MALSYNLLSEFAKITNDKQEKKTETKAYGTVVKQGNNYFVRLDGSELLTPVERVVTAKDDDRVIVTIDNHKATITGNASDPSFSSSEGQKLGDHITEFDEIIAHKVTADEIQANKGYFEELYGIIGKFDDLEAIYAEIERLEAQYIEVDHLNAKDIEAMNAQIERLKAQVVEAGVLSAEDLEAIDGSFERLKAYNADIVYVSAEVLEAMMAQIKALDVESLKAQYADINFAKIVEGIIKKLKSEYADIDFANMDTAQIENLITTMADIDFATINEATINSLKAKYANIDFSNIGDAAIKKLFAETGIIDHLEVRDGIIVSGEIIGVTIKGDIIEGGTVKADKLVVLGEDGIYYKLNIDGLNNVSSQQANKFVLLTEKPKNWETNYKDYYILTDDEYVHLTDEECPEFVTDTYYKLSNLHQSGLDGTNIIAKTITAEKINVDDLVALDATIGGFKITQNSIYSGVKESIDNTTIGLYMDDTGQLYLGDNDQYLKYYKINKPTVNYEIDTFEETTFTLNEDAEDHYYGYFMNGIHRYDSKEKIVLNINTDTETILPIQVEQRCNNTKGDYGSINGHTFEELDGEERYLLKLNKGNNKITIRYDHTAGQVIDPDIFAFKLLLDEAITDGDKYRLIITADDLKFGTNKKSLGQIEENIQDVSKIIIKRILYTEVEYLRYFDNFNPPDNSSSWNLDPQVSSWRNTSYQWSRTYVYYDDNTRLLLGPRCIIQDNPIDETVKPVSIYTQYYISDSTYNPTNGEWSNVMPALDELIDLYLWQRERIEWSDSSISYGPIYLVGKIGFTTNDKLTDLERTLDSAFGTTSDGWEMIFNVLNENWTTLLKYIRFEDGNIILGEEGNSVTLKIENDSIGFYQFGSKVAYLTNNSLKITNAEITNRLDLGEFAFIPGKKGNLTFKKVVK